MPKTTLNEETMESEEKKEVAQLGSTKENGKPTVYSILLLVLYYCVISALPPVKCWPAVAEAVCALYLYLTYFPGIVLHRACLHFSRNAALCRHIRRQGQHKIDKNEDLEWSKHLSAAWPSADKPDGMLCVAQDHEEICKHDCRGDRKGLVHRSWLENKVDANERVVVNFHSKRYHNNKRTTLKKKSKEHLLHAIS
jgi:hypothetical protein